MTFVFQRPGTSRLLTAIDQAAAHADAGGGVYAFASVDGIRSLLALTHISRMLETRRSFHLIVGIDAITNGDALLSLSEAAATHSGTLTAQVFLHDHPASTFHPKFCWFKRKGHLQLITGSGNLTSRGLGVESTDDPPPGNWEAFSVQTFSGADARAAEAEIVDWLRAARIAGTLCSPTDARAENRAMENSRARYTLGPSGVTRPSPPRSRIAPPPVRLGTLTPHVLHDVLLREIPRNRTGQADVGQSALTDFFGFGKVKSILIQHVSLDNVLGPVQQKNLFVNRSRNYRLELNAIADSSNGIAADDGRMILVATKLDERSFRYTIVPTDAPDYGGVSTLLGAIPVAGHRRMRTKKLTADEVRAGWPSAPDNLLPVVLPTPEP